MLGWAVGATYA